MKIHYREWENTLKLMGKHTELHESTPNLGLNTHHKYGVTLCHIK